MNVFMNIISYVAAVFVAITTVPETYLVLKHKNTAHLNLLLFIFLLLGCICFVITGIYFWTQQGFDAFRLAVLCANFVSGCSTATIITNKLINRSIASRRNISETEAAAWRRSK